MGRPTSLNETTAAIVLDVVSKGGTQKAAAEAAGVESQTIIDWRTRGKSGEEPYASFLKAWVDSKTRVRKSKLAKRCVKLAPEKLWAKNILEQYGLTPARYDEILAAQGGGCAVCGRHKEPDGRRLCVDHCHSTGVNRGILCKRCNMLLGMIWDSVDMLQKLLTYLQNSRNVWEDTPANDIAA